MKFRLIHALGTGVIAAGLMAAQTPQPQPQQPNAGQQGRAARIGKRGNMMGRMARVLNLTDDQKAQAKQIFKAAAESGKPYRTEMQQARKALQAAAKSNAPAADIDRLSQDVGRAAAQLAANRTKAFAQFYTILTPEQRQKLDAAGDRFMQNGRGFRPAAFRQNRNRPAPQPQQ